MFRLEVLPAAHGDAIWLEYGDPNAPPYRGRWWTRCNV